MTKPGDQTPSHFDARADKAAQALRQSVNRQISRIPGREPIAESAPVEVDANGKPPAPLPPQGSYARQALELAQRNAAAGQLPAPGQPPQRAEDMPDPAAPPLNPPPPPAAEPPSPRAEARIQELVTQLREKDRELQTALAMGKQATETASQFQARLTQLEQQHQQMLQQNLDSLDPETRASVLADARLSQRLDEFKRDLLGQIAPRLQRLDQSDAQRELHALASKYPGYNHQLHAPLIAQFRESNPRCSIEQAFRAVAEPEELVPRQGARATAVPPFVPPGNGDLGAARYAPQVQRSSQAAQEDELVEESRRIKELRASTDPAKQKEGMRLLDAHLKRRLGG
jgi:exonuclease VII small subunit